MAQPQGSLYEIRWNEIFPWLILVRALRVSVMVRVLAFALVGVLLTEGGWLGIDRVFTEDSAGLEQLTDRLERSSLADSASILQVVEKLQVVESVPQLEDFASRTSSGPLVRAWSWLAQPFAKLTNRETSWRRSLALLLSGIWTIVVWSLLGGAISRISAVYLTRGEMLDPRAAFKASLAKWGSTAAAPLIVLLGVAALAVPMVLYGLLVRLDIFAMFFGLLWVLVLAWGMLLALAMLGLLLGWPLMWATMSVERTDSFDGVSRCYAYVYQRPLHLVFYVLVASCLGFFGEFAVSCFSVAAVALSEWTISWGAGNERTAELVTRAGADAQSALSTNPSVMASVGIRAIQFWKWTLEAIVASYAVGYLWSSSVGIYLLLRRHIDSTEMDEIALDLGQFPQSGLPDLEADESGVPEVKKKES